MHAKRRGGSLRSWRSQASLWCLACPKASTRRRTEAPWLLLGFGEEAEVLSPAELRSKIGGRAAAAAFTANLQQNLQGGRFRLVIVLDSAPDELVRLAGYLEVVAEKLVIDLVTVSAYEVGGAKIIVPQRVDSEPQQDETAPAKPIPLSKGVSSEGADAFEKSIESAKPAERASLRRLVDWARALEKEGLVELSSFTGKLDRWVLLPRLQTDNAGLVTLWNDGSPAIPVLAVHVSAASAGLHRTRRGEGEEQDWPGQYCSRVR